LYHLYKVGRRDYVLWIAGLEGALKYMGALVTHSIVKVLVDYTGMLHCRGPKLAGGALFTFQTIVSQCYPFVALHFYKTSEIEDKTDVDMLNTVFVILASSWFLCVLAFLRVTNRDFWHTFWSTATGWQFTVDSYNKSNDPETKMLTIFENHHSFTESIKLEVIAYMHEHWAEWERTKPAWFTPNFIASVDDEFMPQHAVEAEGGARRRRSSVPSVREMLGIEKE